MSRPYEDGNYTIEEQHSVSMPTDAQERMARALCQERCAFMGEPPCWEVASDDWPNPHCDEPGCAALAAAALACARELVEEGVPVKKCPVTTRGDRIMPDWPDGHNTARAAALGALT